MRIQVPDENKLIERESRVRQITLRAATALSVLLASLLLFMALPLFPRELMVFLAIGLGALAYKAPTPAVLLMLALAIPGYMYQLGSALPPGDRLSLIMIVGVSAILFIAVFIFSQNHGILGIAIGTIAAVLMLTPVHFFALPIILGTVLFRTKDLKTRAASTILVFVILYYPLLAVNSGVSPGGFVPIFEPVSFHAVAPIPVLNLHDISTSFSQVVGTGTGSTQPYLASLADYWPLSFKQRLLPVGLLFCILAGIAMVAVQGMFVLFRWLEKRQVSHAYLSYATPVSSLLVGIMAFFLLTSSLAQPLGYANTLSIPSLLIGTVLVGGSGSLAETWFRRRDRIFNMRDHLADRANAIRSRTDFLMSRTREIKAQCHRMDISAEESLNQICQQELTFTEQMVNDMSIIDLEQKAALFQELHGKLDAALQEINVKLCQYYDEDRQKYNDYLILAKRYGPAPGESLQGPDFSRLTSMEYEEVLRLQMNLNERYQDLARSLSESIDKLEEKLCSEVDPEFKRTGIHIARDYFAQERYTEAIQEFLQELGDIEHILQGILTGLDREILKILNSLKAILTDVLVPIASNLGDVKNVSYYREIMSRIANLCHFPDKNESLPDMMDIVARVSGLGDIMVDLSSKLGERIVILEKSIQDKTPRGYNWGVDPEVRERLAEISQTFRKTSRPVSIRDRMSMLKSGPSVIEAAARSVKDYSIAHEVLINYTNVEHILEEKLNTKGRISYDDLPVKRKYSREYLELYRLKHPGEVYIETDTGMLIRPGEAQAVSEIRSRK